MLLALGLNHRTAPIQIREQVAFPSERLPEALDYLRGSGMTEEVAILSTCNRTEIYCGVETFTEEQLVTWLGEFHRLSPKELKPYLYQHADQGAVRHILRVASGLDSMVLGEPQILGQIKTAYQIASSAGTLGSKLNRLFQHAFSVAKQVRTDTQIGASAVSVAFAAVGLSKQIFPDLSQQTALLIGAGETIELVARHLRDQHIGRLIIANRTYDRAHALAAQVGAYAVSLAEIPAHLAEADIIVSSTASSGWVLSRSQVSDALQQRRHRPIFIVDIAVPRDVDPEVAELEDTYLYTVDDLKDIIAENLRSRQAAAAEAEDIIEVQVEHYMAWLRLQAGVNRIRTLRSKAEILRDDVLERAIKQLAGGKSPEEALTFLAHTLTNRLIHAPSVSLREASAQGDDDVVELISSVYQLEGDNPS